MLFRPLTALALAGALTAAAAGTLACDSGARLIREPPSGGQAADTAPADTIPADTVVVGIAAAPTAADTAARCVVARVVDGDTFHCADGAKVRLIGMDTPELKQGGPGRQATGALQRLLPTGRAVRLELDATERDRYGRTLAYAWVGDTLVNEAMVRGGWAVLYTVPPNVKYAGRLEAAQKAARTAGAGLWAEHGFDCLPRDARRGRCR